MHLLVHSFCNAHITENWLLNSQSLTLMDYSSCNSLFTISIYETINMSKKLRVSRVQTGHEITDQVTG